MEYTYRYVTCDFCGSNDYSIYAVSPTPREVLHPQIVRCNICHLIYANPQITPASLAEYYCNDYPQNMDDVMEFADSGLEKTKQELRNLKLQPRRMLDIGMGWGHFLHAAQSLGWEAWGTEISIPFVEYARRNFQLSNIHIGELPSAQYPDNFFHLVRMWHVLEHVGSPSTYMKEISRVLAPDGVLIIGVPNAAPIQAKIGRVLFQKKKHRYADFGEHTYHFTPATLRHLLVTYGLVIRKQSVYWGSRERKKIDQLSISAQGLIQKCIYRIPNSGPKQSVFAYKS